MSTEDDCIHLICAACGNRVDDGIKFAICRRCVADGYALGEWTIRCDWTRLSYTPPAIMGSAYVVACIVPFEGPKFALCGRPPQKICSCHRDEKRDLVPIRRVRAEQKWEK